MIVIVPQDADSTPTTGKDFAVRQPHSHNLASSSLLCGRARQPQSCLHVVREGQLAAVAAAAVDCDCRRSVAAITTIAVGTLPPVLLPLLLDMRAWQFTVLQPWLVHHIAQYTANAGDCHGMLVEHSNVYCCHLCCCLCW